MSPTSDLLIPWVSEQLDVTDSRNPYPGPTPLGKDQGDLLVGRDRNLEDILEVIGITPIIELYGDSGVGKSSLLRAGVMARTEEREVRSLILDRWSDVSGLWAARVATSNSEDVERSSWGAKASGPQAFATAVSAAASGDPRSFDDDEKAWDYLDWEMDRSRYGLLIVFDQMEELFREDQTLGRAIGRVLLNSIVDVVSERRLPGLQIVLSFREEVKGEFAALESSPRLRVTDDFRAFRVLPLSPNRELLGEMIRKAEERYIGKHGADDPVIEQSRTLMTEEGCDELFKAWNSQLPGMGMNDLHALLWVVYEIAAAHNTGARLWGEGLSAEDARSAFEWLSMRQRERSHGRNLGSGGSLQKENAPNQYVLAFQRSLVEYARIRIAQLASSHVQERKQGQEDVHLTRLQALWDVQQSVLTLARIVPELSSAGFKLVRDSDDLAVRATQDIQELFLSWSVEGGSCADRLRQEAEAAGVELGELLARYFAVLARERRDYDSGVVENRGDPSLSSDVLIAGLREVVGGQCGHEGGESKDPLSEIGDASVVAQVPIGEGLSPIATAASLVVAFERGLRWLRDANIVRLSSSAATVEAPSGFGDRSRSMIALVHDGYGEALKTWAREESAWPCARIFSPLAVTGQQLFRPSSTPVRDCVQEHQAWWCPVSSSVKDTSPYGVSGVRWLGCSISGKFEDVVFRNCDFRGAIFQDSDLRRVVFEDCTLWGTLFRNTTLEDVVVRTTKPGVYTDLNSLTIRDSELRDVEAHSAGGVEGRRPAIVIENCSGTGLFIVNATGGTLLIDGPRPDDGRTLEHVALEEGRGDLPSGSHSNGLEVVIRGASVRFLSGRGSAISVRLGASESGLALERPDKAVESDIQPDLLAAACLRDGARLLN